MKHSAGLENSPTTSPSLLTKAFQNLRLAILKPKIQFFQLNSTFKIDLFSACHSVSLFHFLRVL